MRPLLRNVPEAPAGAVQTPCPYCGAACWALALELQPWPLSSTWTSACTACAFSRRLRQEDMDAARFEAEVAAVLAHLTLSDEPDGN